MRMRKLTEMTRVTYMIILIGLEMVVLTMITRIHKNDLKKEKNTHVMRKMRKYI